MREIEEEVEQPVLDGEGNPVLNEDGTPKLDINKVAIGTILSGEDNQVVDMLVDMTPYGVTAAVYTQTTDVENETNGIMTYDRKVIKFDEQKFRQANQKLINSVK